uniref:Uncharacterized protein n=1 Tax=Acrobeloides nanus TaxID=290746 RepID=A0A914DXB8_9BILA
MYITEQVVDSGKVELEKPLTIKLISVIFSLIPLGGEALSKGAELASIPISSLISCVSSIGEKIFDEAVDTGLHKTSKGKAKNIKQLATDPSDLSQKVSGAAIQIVKNDAKQKQIINITLEYLNKQPDKALQKLQKIFKKIGQKYDKALHDEVYGTAAELLGKKDAKTLIKQYLKYSPQVGFEESIQVIMQDCVHYVVNIDKIREELSKGSCTQELEDLFSKRYLEPKLKQSLKKNTISNQEIEKAQMIMFKYMCKAVKEAQDKNKAMDCVKEFADTTQYKDMVKKVADKHPEYFCTKEIAEQVITDKQILDKVLKKTSNFM